MAEYYVEIPTKFNIYMVVDADSKEEAVETVYETWADGDILEQLGDAVSDAYRYNRFKVKKISR